MKLLPIRIQAYENGKCLSGRTVYHRWAVLLAGLFTAAALIPAAGAAGPTPDTDELKLKRAVVTHYAAIVSATYQDSLAAARKLKAAIDTLVEKPSAQSLAAARESWLAARVPYCQTEAVRFYEGPIDAVEGMVNAWPIDEHYIDYVADHPDAGIINAVSQRPALSRELIISLNEKEGEKNISTGFHALEFLLWGQDFSATGPGNRPDTDFADGTKNVERRRQYLRLVMDLLVDHLETVAAAWAEGDRRNYRAEFLALQPEAALAKILKGIGTLSGPELAGERMTVPYETKESEDEHSCFSDATRDDLLYDAIGIQNVYLGRYASPAGCLLEGPGLHDLLARRDREFADQLAAQIEAGVAAMRRIPQPFDQAILGTQTSPGRVALKHAISAFQTQSEMIAQAAKVLSINLNL